MRKAILIVLLIAILGGCAKGIETPSVPSVTPYEKGRYYEIYNITKHTTYKYLYFIFDINSDILDYGVDKSPDITMTNGLVKIDIGCGTGCHNCRYIDPEKRLVSEWFFNPITESETMIVYFSYAGGIRLIVQDIFDKSKYYKSFARNFSPILYPVSDADFINGGKQLRITYKAGQDEHEVTETLELYQAGTEGAE